MTSPNDAYAVAHRMLPGSHERPSGPECRCGAVWDYWGDRCVSEITKPDYRAEPRRG